MVKDNIIIDRMTKSTAEHIIYASDLHSNRHPATCIHRLPGNSHDNKYSKIILYVGTRISIFALFCFVLGAVGKNQLNPKTVSNKQLLYKIFVINFNRISCEAFALDIYKYIIASYRGN